MSRKSLSEQMKDFFESNPGDWIHFRKLAAIGGIGGWRTRVSECRTKFGMAIENRQEKDDRGFTQSYYRYAPKGVQRSFFD